MNVTYRELDGGDTAALMGLRLSVMESDPFSFSVTADEEKTVEEGVVKSAVESYGESSDRVMLGAWNQSLCGVVGIERYGNELEKHKVRLWGPYVETRNRGKGIGGSLINKAIEFAFSVDGVEIITLETTSKASHAHELFLSQGFHKTGAQNRALLFGGEYVDIISMQRHK
jgi:RimJ/RimL family protein N-acetyltransferase